MRLRQLFEEIARTGKGKSAVVGWGRGMGHKGHMMLASSVITQAKETGADPYFVVSKTIGKDDPITPEEKLHLYKKVFPKHSHIFHVATDEMPDLNRVLTQLGQHGYTDATVIVGADQKAAFQYLVRPDKSGVEPYKQFGLKSLHVISRQETNDPSAGEEGPRATPMRDVLKDPNATDEQKFQDWRDAMSPEVSDDEVRDLMAKAAQRMADPTWGKKPKAAKKEKAVAEISDETRNKYVARASDDYGSANFAARASKSHPGLEKYSQEQEHRAKKRAAGLNRALSDKRRNVAEDESKAMADAAKRLTNPNDGKVMKLRAAGDKRREEHLKSRDIAKKNEGMMDLLSKSKKDIKKKVASAEEMRKFFEKEKAKEQPKHADSKDPKNVQAVHTRPAYENSIKYTNKLLREMRAQEFISEGKTTDLHPDHENVMKGVSRSRDVGGYDRVYHMNRIMMAMAMADGVSTGKIDGVNVDTWFEKYNTMHPLTQEEDNMIRAAMKTVPTDGKHISKFSKSIEPEGANTKSVVAKPKRNKYGI